MLIACTVFFTVAAARLAGSSTLVLALCCLFAGFGFDIGCSPVRAHAFTFLFVALLLLMFQLDQRGHRKWMLLWLPLFVLWVNLHGGFLVGIGFVGIYWLEECIRRRPHWHLLGLASAMGLATCINPFGLDYAWSVFQTTQMDRPSIGEWSSIWEDDEAYRLAIFLIGILIFGYLAFVKRAGCRFGLGLLAITTFEVCLHVRLLPIWTLTWIVVVTPMLQSTQLPQHVASSLNRFPKTWLCINLGGVLALLIHLTLQAPWYLRVPGEPLKPGQLYYPVGAVEYLQDQGFRGNLMTFYDDGSYVLWKCWPHIRVGMDSRYEVAYPTNVVEDNLQLYLSARTGQRCWTNTTFRLS